MAQPLTAKQIREYAARILCETAEQVDRWSIGEVLADDIGHLPDAEFDAAVDAVDDAISAATVTVTWPAHHPLTTPPPAP